MTILSVPICSRRVGRVRTEDIINESSIQKALIDRHVCVVSFLIMISTKSEKTYVESKI